jgi:hypothetical protein
LKSAPKGFPRGKPFWFRPIGLALHLKPGSYHRSNLLLCKKATQLEAWLSKQVQRLIVSCEDVKVMMQGFEKAGNSHASFFELPNVNHVFKEVPGTPNPGLDYGNPNLKFSQ